MSIISKKGTNAGKLSAPPSNNMRKFSVAEPEDLLGIEEEDEG